ncbi:hypothetical protein [Paenibacillus sp. KN14-4R]|uniref:hypothetical protein n=1 Tax=Paenibacillus sp. KN14-4R TaxID=3445773 RepID=UPI003FA02CD3
MIVQLADPPITAEVVYDRFRSHFESISTTELLAAARSSLPNTKKEYYQENAKTSIDDRKRIVEEVVPLTYRYFDERQPDGYVKKRPRALCFPTFNEYQALELLTDYIIADDLKAGLTLKDRFREEMDENCFEYPPLGSGARAYQELEMNFLTPKLLANRKVCEVCRSYFIDTSRANNAKRCSKRCMRWAEMLRKRKSRNDEDSRRLRDRERQQYEYPFYSPYELEHINKFPEACYSEDSINRKVQQQKRGGRKKPQDVTMDTANVSGHFKPYNPSIVGESGQMIVKQRRPEVIKRYLRMKYGTKKDTPDIRTYS